MNTHYQYRRWLFTLFLVAIMLTVPMMVYAVSTDSGKAPLDLRTAISQVAERNIPSVVHIEVTQHQEVTNPLLPFENEPFFRYFFGTPNMPKKFKRELRGLGTGIIMDAQGHILTNNHVVGGASKIEVLLSDGKQYSAKLVGTDPKTDLAVIQVSAGESLPYVTFGDSDQVKVGEWVVAIGHPRGLDQTVTQGIISAKHRQGITDPTSYQDFLQTDAAINPGNSGGPLLNLNGEVIGVNAAIVSQSGGFEGIGFAIPSNMALHVAKQLIAQGKVERGWLGVSIQEVTSDLAKTFGLKEPKGALIADVLKGGPAEKAGLQRGDVIVAYQGKDIVHASDLRNQVANTPIGQEAKVTVIRKGEKQEITITVGNLEDATKMLASQLKDRLGADFRPLTQKEVQEHNLKPQMGAAVVWLDPQGSLAKVGFEVGDVILQINGRDVQGVQGLIDLVTSIKPNSQVIILALDHNSGQTGYVQVVIK